MIQKIRHIVHLIIVFFSDYLYLLGRPLFYQFQFQRFKNEIKKNDNGKPLCILGNGPSFTFVEEHLNEMKTYDFCAVNLSVNTDIFFKIKPKMYVIVDMIFWQHQNEPKFIEVKKNISRIDWDIEIFLPYNCPNSFKNELEKNHNIIVCRYANNCWEPELMMAKRLKMWFYKKGLISPNGSNVSIAAVYTALLKGYKSINLIGVELSWMKDIKVNDNNEVVLIDRHYYGETEHVWLDYDGKPIKLIDFLSSQLSTFTGHMNLRQFADYMGAKVVNRAKGSYIDAYDRGAFEEMLIQH